ncbi:MAG: Smr/MutS family protein [Chitinophagales bacterium]
MNKKIDAELLRAMMMGEYSPTNKDDLAQDWVSNDLHYKGKSKSNFSTVHDQLHKCQKVIDKAILVNKEKVTIIHGKGNAILKKEVHDLLKKHNQVKRFELNTDNEGETIVYLK